MCGRQVPSGWQPVRLRDVATVETGGTPSRSRAEFWGGSINWMSSGEVHQRRVVRTEEGITEVGLSSSNAKLFPPGTLMVALNGQGRTRGMVAVLGIVAACNQSLAAITVREGVSQSFLFHNLDARYQELRALTGNAGRSGLNLGLIRTLPLLLPPFDEQVRIAGFLDTVDQAIEKTEAVIEAGERVRAGLAQDFLTRGAPGYHRAWKEVRGIGTIPECWDVVRLEDICEHITKGATPTTFGHRWVDAGVAFLRSECVGDGEFTANGIAYITRQAQAAMARSVVSGGDILMTITGYIGRVCRLPADFPQSNINQHIARIRVERTALADASFVYWALRHPRVAVFLRKEITGIAYPQIGLAEVRAIRVPLPTMREQRSIAQALDAAESRRVAEGRLLQDLQALKQVCADALLSGRVRVPCARRGD